MKDFFVKNKIYILRAVGIVMLLVSFAVYFWATPKEGLSQNEIAARNIARIEARVAGGSGSSKKAPQSSSAKIMQELKNTQEKQLQYLIIISIIIGIGFLGYSFVKPKEDEQIKPDSEK